MENKKIVQLDVFRGLAALSVCAVHFTYNSFFHNYFAQGLFVQLFFALSGFVICYNYYDRINNLICLKNFLLKRFKRLYPLHLFFLFIFLFLEILKYLLLLKYDIKFNNLPFEINNLKNFLLNFFLLQHFADQYNFNGPSWSISIEIMLYITFGILILINKKVTTFLSILYIFVFIIFFNSIYGKDLSILGYFSGLYSFFIGYLFCILFKKNFFVKKRLFNFFYILILLIFLLEIFIFRFLNYKFIYSIFFGLIFYASCYIETNSKLFKILFNKYFIFLGRISYSIYLSHLLVFFLIDNFLKHILNFDTKLDYNNNQVLDLTSLEANTITFFSYLITIGFSAMTYNYIEMKFYKK